MIHSLVFKEKFDRIRIPGNENLSSSITVLTKLYFAWKAHRCG